MTWFERILDALSNYKQHKSECLKLEIHNDLAVLHKLIDESIRTSQKSSKVSERELEIANETIRLLEEPKGGNSHGKAYEC